MKSHFVHFCVLAFALCVGLGLPLKAQYKFDSKTYKKAYEKAREAFEAYDYATLLGMETELVSHAEAKKDTLTALVYDYLAEAHSVQGDPLKAYAYYNKEYALRQQLQKKEEYDYSALVYNMAMFAMDMGRFEEAERLFTELAAEDRNKYGPKSEEYAQTIKNLAELYKNMGAYNKSESTLHKLMREIGQGNPQYPSVVANLAVLYTVTGEYSKSEKTFERALSLLENSTGKASADYVATLANLSFLYQSAGRYADAEETLTEALHILDRLQGSTTEARSLIYNYTGIVKFRMGLFEESVRYFTQGLEIDKELFGAESPAYAYSLNILGTTYTYMGEHEKAVATIGQSLEILGKLIGKESFRYTSTQANLALAYINNGQLNQALENMTAVLAADKATLGQNHPDYATSVHNMGNLQFKMSKLPEAEKYYGESLKIRRRALGVSHPGYAETTRHLAMLKWAMRDAAAAEAYYKETFNNFFAQIGALFPVLSEDEKATFYFTKLRNTFEEFNSFAVERSADNPAVAGDMYNIQLATKGLILYATAKVRESIVNSKDTLLLDKYQEWVSQKEKIARLYSANDEELAVRNRKIDSLSVLANRLEKELSAASAAFANTFSRRDYTWQNVRDKLKPGEAAVEIIRFREFSPAKSGTYTDNVYYAALVVKSDTKEYPELLLLKNGHNMEEKYLANYRNAIHYKIEESYSYGLFWKPIANKLKGIKKVYLSPDGVYNQVSINSLRNPETNKYILDELEIHLVTNTKDLVEQSAKPAGNSTGTAMLIGYPNYNRGTFTDMLAANASEVVSAAGLGRGTRGMRDPREEANPGQGSAAKGLSRGIRGNLNRHINNNNLLALLPGTKVEVEKINKLHTSSRSQSEIILGDSALETSIKNVKYPRTLHVATHGFFLENPANEKEVDTKYVENPLLRSGLIFAGANSYLATGEITQETGGEDGILTAYEAMNLFLDNTELVVLSACETGLGQVKNGEGVYGLQRAFKVAGAQSMLMSMWTVDDNATQELMTNFYDTWLKTGDKYAAFLKAQRELKAKYPEPYYWGAFVMVGE